jgi:hypothetical protein
VTLIGKPGGLGNPYEMSLLVILGGNPADTDPWLKEWFDFWGTSSWGPVYARVNATGEFWPDQKTEIMRALKSSPP